MVEILIIIIVLYSMGKAAAKVGGNK